MDYEKKYNEALNDMRAIYPNLKGDAKLAVEHAFPELRESEDERIRKALLDGVRQIRCKNGITQEQMIAYLEKQKEQKPVEYLSKRKVYDIMNKLTELSTSELIPLESEEYVKIHEITSDVCGLLDYPIEQKSIQTSEEKEYIRTLKSLISDFIRDKQPEDVIYYQRIYDWLEGRHIEQKPAEWSKEDEELRDNIICTLQKDVTYTPPTRPNSCTGSGNAFYTHQTEINWLKSLRPSWKPSEEQMIAILRAEGILRLHEQEEVAKRLAKLYEQLKKLM